MEWLTVICLIFCVLKCSTMTLNDIEDFKNFLEKTSQLDQILVKKGPTPDHDKDDDETISDYAWEESGKFEGDLILNDRQRKIIAEDVAEGLSRNGLQDITKRWPDNELIYYIQREHFNGDQVQAIQDGIDDLAQAACVKFRPYRKGDKDAVVIQGSRRGCFSNVGYQGGYQVLNLNGRHPPGRGCFRHGTIVHELLHSLGFYHMQSSPDRDDYIDVLWENIHEPAKHNFRKYNTFSVSDFGVGYDYDSVLHYGRRAFSRNGQDTLVPKQSGASIGQRVRLSDKDVQKLTKMYCDAQSDNNDAAEEPSRKPLKKKDNAKNKPFQGHGIGYHQGKTIAIKLPAAETIKLTNSPTFHLFDHFSKTPEAVPQTFIEEVGAGKGVTYKFDPESFYEEDDSTSRYPYGKNDYKYLPHNAEQYEATLIPITKDDNKVRRKDEVSDLLKSKSKVTEGNNNSSVVSSAENPKEIAEVTKIDYSGKVNDVVDEAFDRLGKIIKTHVYPSHTPDLEVYKTKLDHSKYFDPEKNVESKSDIIEEHEFDTTDKSTEKESVSNEDNSDEVNSNENEDKIKLPVKDLKNENYSDEADVTTNAAYSNDHIPRGFDSSYGTTFALKRMPKTKEEVFVTPEYATYKNLHKKHDYSGFYQPNREEPKKKRKHTLFGYLVPLNEKHIDAEDVKKDNFKYDPDRYTPYKEYENVSSKLKQHVDDDHTSDHNRLSRLISSGEGYSLFGVLVPLSKKWFKVDYNPHSRLYSIQNPESSEDYR